MTHRYFMVFVVNHETKRSGVFPPPSLDGAPPDAQLFSRWLMRSTIPKVLTEGKDSDIFVMESIALKKGW